MITKAYVHDNYRIITADHTPSQTAQRLPFCLFGCGHFLCNDDYYTKRKGLKNFLLIYTLEGKGIIKYRNLELEATKNTCFVINCEEYQYYRTAPKNSWNFYYIHFSGLCANEYFEIINENSLYMITIQNSKDFTLLFDELLQLKKQKTELVDFKLSLNISKMMTTLIEDKQSLTNTIFSKHKEDIHKTKEFIELHYASEIDILTLSQSVNISKFYFIKLFKELVGQTPYEYLIGVRINNSKRLLKETELSVGEIANKVGFCDINNYIKAFKKLTGTTPLKFKLHWVV